MAAGGEGSGYPEGVRRVLDLLAIAGDRSERIQLLIDLADRFRGVPPEIAQPPYDRSHLVPNCESEAYLWALPRADGTLDFHFAVENPQGISAKAFAVILEEGYSGAPLETAARASTDLPIEIFGSELSMGKSMGLLGMVSMVQREARRRLEAREAT